MEKTLKELIEPRDKGAGRDFSQKQQVQRPRLELYLVFSKNHKEVPVVEQSNYQEQVRSEKELGQGLVSCCTDGGFYLEYL